MELLEIKGPRAERSVYLVKAPWGLAAVVVLHPLRGGRGGKGGRESIQGGFLCAYVRPLTVCFLIELYKEIRVSVCFQTGRVHRVSVRMWRHVFVRLKLYYGMCFGCSRCVCVRGCVLCVWWRGGGGSTHYVRGIFSLRPVARTRGEGIFSLSK